MPNQWTRTTPQRVGGKAGCKFQAPACNGRKQCCPNQDFLQLCCLNPHPPQSQLRDLMHITLPLDSANYAAYLKLFGLHRVCDDEACGGVEPPYSARVSGKWSWKHTQSHHAQHASALKGYLLQSLHRRCPPLTILWRPNGRLTPSSAGPPGEYGRLLVRRRIAR